MGIGSNRIGRTVCVALVTLEIFCATALALEHKTGIWRVMRDGGFRAAMNEDTHVWPIGDMAVGSKHYHFEHYEWFESKRNMVPGGFPHGAVVLLVFERTKRGLTYLGGYENPEGGRPRIEGHSVIFPFKDIEIMGVKKAKVITFDENGPPTRVRLSEDYVEFHK